MSEVLYQIHARNVRDPLAVEMNPWPGKAFHQRSKPMTLTECHAEMDRWQQLMVHPGWTYTIEPVAANDTTAERVAGIGE